MKYLLLTLLTFGFLTSKGAVILTQSNATPVIGNSYINTLADTNVTEGLSGTSVNWIYNNLSITPSVHSINCIDPVTTPYYSSFPTATITLDDSTTMQYVIASASDLQLLGEGSTSGVLQFNSPITYLTFPFSYNSVSTNSNIPGTFPQGTVDASYTATADGSGSLVVNGVTFPDVLRVKVVKDFVYNYTGLGIISEYTVSYAWYDGVSPLPVFEIVVSDLTGAIQAHSKAVRVSSIITKTDDFTISNPAAILFPNPANSEFKISTSNNEKISSIRILNTSGLLVKEILKDNSILSESIDISDLSAGCYFVEMIADQKQVLKLMVY